MKQDIRSIAIGAGHICASTLNELKCWGTSDGKKGSSSKQTLIDRTSSLFPVLNGFDLRILLLAATAKSTCGLFETEIINGNDSIITSRLECWGSNT
mmetsp:Transcript_26368/g.22204  ORF Transcript_26368/g.22204 Transcript_26368/m.22204 type:complete len:97 (+) Transcript_26368:355-645(+)